MRDTELPDVFWLGGGCGSGKTSVSRVVAATLDLRLYPVDHHGYDHILRSNSESFPRTREFAALSDLERWNRSPEELAAFFADISRERMPLVLADLRALGRGPTVLVEGPQLFPEFVVPHLKSRRHGLWLLPTPEFGRKGVARRGEKLRGADEVGANRNRYGRDVLLTDLNRRQARKSGLDVLLVDGSRSVQRIADEVLKSLISLPRGLVRAMDGRERQSLRTAENAVATRQLLAYWADVGSATMPLPPFFDFSCECRDLGCARTLSLSVTDYGKMARGGHVVTHA